MEETWTNCRKWKKSCRSSRQPNKKNTAFKRASVRLIISQKKLWKREGHEWHLTSKGLNGGQGTLQSKICDLRKIFFETEDKWKMCSNSRLIRWKLKEWIGGRTILQATLTSVRLKKNDSMWDTTWGMIISKKQIVSKYNGYWLYKTTLYGFTTFMSGRVNPLFLPELGNLSFPALGQHISWFSGHQIGLSYTTRFSGSPAWRWQLPGFLHLITL